jgi:branched-chain amino acid transport system substrate-binding protein
MLIAEAILQVGRVGDDGVLRIGRRAFAEAIRATRVYQGVTGLLDCASRQGDCGSGVAVVWQVRGGRYEVAWRPER